MTQVTKILINSLLKINLKIADHLFETHIRISNVPAKINFVASRSRASSCSWFGHILATTICTQTTLDIYQK